MDLDLGDTMVESVPPGAAANGRETAELDQDRLSGVVRNPTPRPAERRTDPLSLLGSLLGGRYMLERVLGTGGMGAVYRARDGQNGRAVAIKVLRAELTDSPDAVHRFLREARTTSALLHPNVVRIVDVGLEAPTGLMYLVMELLHGETAEEQLAKRERLPLEEALRIVVAVLRGLGAAHALGIIHRDLKPANVFLTETEVKLIDFGIAKSARSPGQISLKLTTPGIVLGTPHYLSPEQARGEGEIDARSDVYAAGVLLYELLTGQTPFDRATYVHVLAAICREEAVPIRQIVPEVPAAIEAVVARAMEKARDNRYGSALEMLEAIETLLAPPAAEPVQPEKPVEGDATVPFVLPSPDEVEAELGDREPPPVVHAVEPPPPRASRVRTWLLGAAALLAVGGFLLMAASLY